MKTLLCTAALGLGLLLATHGHSDAVTSESSIAERGRGNGGSTAPRGEVLDIAERGRGNGGSTAPRGEVLDIV